MPLFIKPNNQFSSIGTNKVTHTDEIINLFQEDNEVLVEEFIHGREFTVGIFKCNWDILVFPITEINSVNTYFNFDANYGR